MFHAVKEDHMVKRKKQESPESSESPESVEETTGGESPKESPEETPKESSEKPVSIVKAPPAEIVEYKSPVLKGLAESVRHPAFLEMYHHRLQTVQRPTLKDLMKILHEIPEEYQEKVTALLRRMDPNRPGLYLADSKQQPTELRLYQGTGNDPNRPENCRVGHFYYTTKQNVGASFTGTVIALWEGRTLWPGPNDPRTAPICSSMNRVMGSRFGLCETCPSRPWRNGQKTDCNDDVVVYMLPDTLDDIILVRFSRTSAPTGRQLASYASKSIVPWQRFYRLTASERQGQGKKNIQWHVMKVEPAEEKVPFELLDLCAALCAMASHDLILPGLARIYDQAHGADEYDDTETPASDAKVDMSNPDGSVKVDYDDFDAAPDSDNV